LIPIWGKFLTIKVLVGIGVEAALDDAENGVKKWIEGN
jgi:hypothetical protein